MKGSNIPKSALMAYKANDEKDGSRLVPKK